MHPYRGVEPAAKAPALPLSAQMCITAEMAGPEIRGLAHMIGTEWQAEALRLESAIDALVTIARNEDRRGGRTVALEMLETMGIDIHDTT